MFENILSLSDAEIEVLGAAFWLSTKLAFSSTIILLIFCTPLAWCISQMKGVFKYLLQALLCLPLVLPPSVLGFYLLILFRPDSYLGQLWYQLTESQLLFSFYALLLASIIYSLPFVLQPLVSSFEQLEKKYLELAKNLGAKPLDTFFSVVLPLNRNAYLIAFVLGFAHTLGEFGVVLLVGGNIAGETRVISIAIYDQVELMNYELAHVMAFLMLLLSLILLVPVYALNGGLLKMAFSKPAKAHGLESYEGLHHE